MTGGFEVRLGGGFAMQTLGGFHANTHTARSDAPLCASTARTRTRRWLGMPNQQAALACHP